MAEGSEEPIEQAPFQEEMVQKIIPRLEEAMQDLWKKAGQHMTTYDDSTYNSLAVTFDRVTGEIHAVQYMPFTEHSGNTSIIDNQNPSLAVGKVPYTLYYKIEKGQDKYTIDSSLTLNGFEANFAGKEVGISEPTLGAIANLKEAVKRVKPVREYKEIKR